MEDSEVIVEAIDEGRIVRVSESYAKREGLPILRRHKIVQEEPQKSQSPSSRFEIKKKENPLIHDNLRKSDWREKQVLLELKENFHWLIRMERKKRGMTRKQFAHLLNEPEDSIRLLENGCIPTKDFVLINKIQQIMGLNLRKDGRDFSKSARELLPQEKETKVIETKKEKKESLFGDDIELIEDEF